MLQETETGTLLLAPSATIPRMRRQLSDPQLIQIHATKVRDLLQRSLGRHSLIITSCTRRKRLPSSLSSSDLRVGVQDKVVAAWLVRLSKAVPIAPAAELYCGRAFSLAKRSAAEADADLAIVSAGLGLVLASDPIPSYDLTFSRGGMRKTIYGAFDARNWWRAVSGGPYSADLRDLARGRSAVLICLSSSYSAYVEDVLEEIASETRLRIFGAGLVGVLSQRLQPFVLPYDSRLGIKFCAGTQTDFAQRALFHYVKEVEPRKLSLADERNAILETLAGTPVPSRGPKRKQLDDDGIRQVIRRLIPIIGKKRSPMLRYLRDKEDLACEQGRFARLFNEVIASNL
jgi:hypothetical protein